MINLPRKKWILKAIFVLSYLIYSLTEKHLNRDYLLPHRKIEGFVSKNQYVTFVFLKSLVKVTKDM